MIKIKHFEIDWDSTSDLKKHIELFSGRRKELLRKNPNYDTISFSTSRFTLNNMMGIFEYISGLKYPNISMDVKYET